MTAPRAAGRRPAVDERGQLAGIEAVPFGLLVVVAALLLIANAWGVVDAKLAASAAAREAARAYVEAPAGTDGMAQAEAAARGAVAGYRRDPDRLGLRLVEGSPSRCAAVRFEATYPVPVLVVPWVGGFGEAFVARSSHREIVDPYRSGLDPGSGRCGP